MSRWGEKLILRWQLQPHRSITALKSLVTSSLDSCANHKTSSTKNVIRAVRRGVRIQTTNALRFLASAPQSRGILNAIYSRLPLEQKEHCHTRYAKVFRDTKAKVARGTWQVDFAGKKIVLPIGGPEMWLEWDAALSILGHETEIRRAYSALLRSRHAPATFFDIGANYGLHSLLFMAHGIRTVSFEPNATCHDYFQRAAQMNRFSHDVRPLAVGDDCGVVDLWFPSTNTWYGTIIPDTPQKHPQNNGLEKLSVNQTTLDKFVEETSLKPDLIKIDTEGAESRILRGALNTLNALRPLVIFESWPEQDRDQLFGIFADAGYAISTLRHPRRAPRVLEDIDDFGSVPDVNFLAAPVELGSGDAGAFRLL